MTVEQLQKQVKSFIGNNDLKGALDAFDNAIDNKSKVAKVLAILLGEWKELEHHRVAGLMDYAEKTKHTNSLSNRLLSLSESFDLKDLKNQSPLLVICKNEIDKTFMQEFFRRMELPNAKVKILEEFEAVDKDVLLIVFDNHSIVMPRIEQKCKCEDMVKKHLGLEISVSVEKPKMCDEDNRHLQLMKIYIEKSGKYMIHFGNYLPIVDQNRDTVHAANSKFALFSRIQEMLFFIKNDKLSD